MANENTLILILFLLLFVMITGYLITLTHISLKLHKKIELIKKETEDLAQNVLDASTKVNKETLYLYKKMLKLHGEISNK